MNITRALQGPSLPLEQLLERLIYYLITTWGIVILIGTFASAIVIVLGLISWFTGISPKRGKRMIIGGIVLFIAMQWLSINPPWNFIFG